ncbi:hypothetical protein P4H39_23240 [Paenibacillus lautus]|uniref:hypothetical protein n=1 Tax=Paenibacillus lautus TaxID=1401 RepID=UPI002DBCB43E|nr:hypothetical protein [Paenibacillus lautus]MEC0205527.1 hypothetical protein [Paenibacillus lautus]
MISLRKEERQYNDADSSSIRDIGLQDGAALHKAAAGYSIRMLPSSMRMIVLRLFFQATALGIYP